MNNRFVLLGAFLSSVFAFGVGNVMHHDRIQSGLFLWLLSVLGCIILVFIYRGFQEEDWEDIINEKFCTVQNADRVAVAAILLSFLLGSTI